MMNGPYAAVRGTERGEWVGACRDPYPNQVQPELPRTRLGRRKPERSVLHMC
jgi:hypothetical protein